jgi:TRAP-type C4-dicarboxylate transport system permease small subunit
MRKIKGVLLFISSLIALSLSIITAISAITLSFPELDPKMAIGYKISYSIGFAAFPLAFLILSIFLFLKGRRFLKSKYRPVSSPDHVPFT